MRHLVRLVTPPGGLVLDPFMGSGSTGKAAILEGARFVGCDLDPAYLEIAAARIRFALRLEAEEAAAAYESTRQLSLFGDP
jgi:site-specific DNA-methyltransferase (adenine-specific)